MANRNKSKKSTGHIEIPPQAQAIKIPIEGIQKQMISGEMQGPGETLALLSDKIPEQDVGKVLEIIHDREKNNEAERQRQFNAFKMST